MWRACPRMTQVCMYWNTSQWPSRVASVITMSSVALTNTLEMPAKPPLAMLMQAWLTLDLLDEQAPLQQDGKLETSCIYFQYTNCYKRHLLSFEFQFIIKKFRGFSACLKAIQSEAWSRVLLPNSSQGTYTRKQHIRAHANVAIAKNITFSWRCSN